MSDEQVLNVPCTFGTVGFGKDTARIGIKVERSQLPLESADELLCGMRLTGKLTADVADPDQKQLPGMEGSHDSVAGSFDVKSISLKPDEIGFGATFSVASVDQHALIALRSRTGRIVITDAQVLPDDSDSDDADDHEDVGPMAHKPIRGQKSMPEMDPVEKLGDPGAGQPLTALVQYGMTTAKIELIEDAIDCRTIGDLERVISKDAWWHKKVKGFGQTWIDKLTDALGRFRSRYPTPDEADVRNYEDGYTQGVEDFGFDAEAKNPLPQGTWDAKGWDAGFDDAKNLRVKLVGAAKSAIGDGVQVTDDATLSAADDDEGTDVDDVDNEELDELETE